MELELGETIDLEGQHFNDIIWTLMTFGNLSIKAVESHGRQIGVAFREEGRDVEEL